MLVHALAIAAISFYISTACLAQELSVNLRLGAGKTAKATATPVAGEGVLLEIEVAGGITQTFPRLGDQLVSISGNGDAGLIARDLDKDGVDEIILRGALPSRSAMVVLRWDANSGEFIPLDFTDDRDRTFKFMIADPSLPVRISASGEIEAEFETTRQDGRKSHHVARYKWDGRAYTQSASN
jgi:hypothetical protein